MNYYQGWVRQLAWSLATGLLGLGIFACEGPVGEEGASAECDEATVDEALVGDPDPSTKVDLVKLDKRSILVQGKRIYIFEGLIRVANLSPTKQVGIAGTTGNGVWQDYPGSFRTGLPDGTELWTVSATGNLAQFAVKYSVNGSTYWDNNGGADYRSSNTVDVILGRNTAIWPLSAVTLNANQVRLEMLVRNLAYQKEVGARYTLNSWATYADQFGAYDPGGFQNFRPEHQEAWRVDLPLNSARSVTFAGFYRLPSLGQEYWANQGRRNFTIQCPAGANQACTIQ